MENKVQMRVVAAASKSIIRTNVMRRRRHQRWKWRRDDFWGFIHTKKKTGRPYVEIFKVAQIRGMQFIPNPKESGKYDTPKTFLTSKPYNTFLFWVKTQI